MVAVRNTEVHHDIDVLGRRDLAPPPVLRLAPARRRPTEATYRRRRLVVGTAVALLSLAALRVAAPVLGDPAGVPLEAGGVHVVRPGDTYWSVAASLDGDGDIRDTVDALTAANGARALQVGDRLALPG